MATRPRPATDPITLRLDRWASILRNADQTPHPEDGELCVWLTEDEAMDLSTLLTAAGNNIRADT
jgi:hypothetical protein